MRKKISISALVFFTLIAFAASFHKIESYYGSMFALDDGMLPPRTILLTYGLNTALDYFPIGAGFSNYGTSAAFKFYSPLYTRYDFADIWGMSEENSSFIFDNSLGLLLGQFGFLGVVVYGAFFIALIQIAHRYTYGLFL